jgi:hypothetical protein
MEKDRMTTLRPTADGSGFLQETTGFEMAPGFSTADGHTACDDAGQGGFNGVPTTTLTPAAITRYASSRLLFKTTVSRS